MFSIVVRKYKSKRHFDMLGLKKKKSNQQSLGLYSPNWFGVIGLGFDLLKSYTIFEKSIDRVFQFCSFNNIDSFKYVILLQNVCFVIGILLE